MAIPQKIKWFYWEPSVLSKSKFSIYCYLILFVPSGDVKMSYMEGEALARKKDPGPQHKYTLNYELQSNRPKTPFYVSMSKS
jgi:hypothetical protein